MTSTNFDAGSDPAVLLDDLFQVTKRLYQNVSEDRDDAINEALEQRQALINQLATVLPGASLDQLRAIDRPAKYTLDMEAQITDLLQDKLDATGDRVRLVKRGARMLRGYSGKARARAGGAVLNQQA